MLCGAPKWNKMAKSTIKAIVSEFLGYLKYKVDNDLMTMEDITAIAKVIQGGLDVRGTAEDFAGYFGKTTDDVRHVIHNSVLDKPVRRVYYSFAKFLKGVPQRWLHK